MGRETGDSPATRSLGFLWPESEPEKARRILTQALYALRRDLGEEDLFLGSNEVRLNPDLMTSDRFDFRKAIEAGQPGARRVVLLRTLPGRLLCAGSAGIRALGRNRKSHVSESVRRRARGAGRSRRGSGESRPAIVWWRKLATVDPHNGQVALGLMKALVASGDRSAALQHYRVFEALCRQELDLDVEPEVAVYAASLKRQVTTTPGQARGIRATSADAKASEPLRHRPRRSDNRFHPTPTSTLDLVRHPIERSPKRSRRNVPVLIG